MAQGKMSGVSVVQGVLMDREILNCRKGIVLGEREQSSEGESSPHHQATNRSTRKRVGNSRYMTALGGREIIVHQVVVVSPLALPELCIC